MWLIALKSLAGTSKLGERQKIGRKRSTVAPYFEKIRSKRSTVAPYLMPYRVLCNDMQREGVQPSPDLAFGLCCYVLFHNSWYGLPYFPDLRDTLPVSPSPQPRAPRPAGTLPYAYSSPAHQS